MKEEKKKAHKLEPVMQIGKNGLTNPIIKEVKRQLKDKKLIKVKILRSAYGNVSKKEFARQLALKTDSQLIQQVGFVVVLRWVSKN